MKPMKRKKSMTKTNMTNNNLMIMLLILITLSIALIKAILKQMKLVRVLEEKIALEYFDLLRNIE